LKDYGFERKFVIWLLFLLFFYFGEKKPPFSNKSHDWSAGPNLFGEQAFILHCFNPNERKRGAFLLN